MTQEIERILCRDPMKIMGLKLSEQAQTLIKISWPDGKVEWRIIRGSCPGCRIRSYLKHIEGFVVLEK